MIRTLLRAGLLAAVCIAANAEAASRPATRTTAKGAAPFAQCFTQAQDRASRAWSFVPRESGGGTFSNAGVVGVRKPYWLQVSERGVHGAKLSIVGADRSLLRAVDSCI